MKKQAKVSVARLFVLVAVMLLSVQIMPPAEIYGEPPLDCVQGYFIPFDDLPTVPIQE